MSTNEYPEITEIETTEVNEQISRWVSYRIGTEDLRLDIAEYLKSLETRPSAEVCKCLWAPHPDDVNKPMGEQRKRRVDVHPECPAHTREGLILGYIEHWTQIDDTFPLS